MTAGRGTAAARCRCASALVAAGTHDRALTRTLRLGDGTALTGAGQGDAALPATRIVDGSTGAPAPADAALCKAGSLNGTAVRGAIVTCRRGVTGRTDKSRAVRPAGGVGMVLYNDPDAALDADLHVVPTVHLDRAGGLRVRAYAATSAATAPLDAAVPTRIGAPGVAATSSAGPAASRAARYSNPTSSPPAPPCWPAPRWPARPAPRH